MYIQAYNICKAALLYRVQKAACGSCVVRISSRLEDFPLFDVEDYAEERLIWLVRILRSALRNHL